MSTVVQSKSFLFNSDLGNVLAKVEQVDGFDVEDIIRDRAGSQARAVQFLNLGKKIDPNFQTAPRTIPSVFLNNTEELEE